MSGEKYPTISMMIPLLHKLLNISLKISDNDDACTKEIKTAISNDLSIYQSTAIQKLIWIPVVKHYHSFQIQRRS